jgi:hypothetical protein
MSISSGLNRRNLLRRTAAAVTTPIWSYGTSTQVVAAEATPPPLAVADSIDVDEPPVSAEQLLMGDISKILTDGRVPPARDQTAWTELLEAFFEQYSVFIDPKEPTQPGEALFSLETNLRVKRIDELFTYTPTQSANYNSFRVESLMNKVADLLDRCLGAKRELTTILPRRLICF